MKFKKFHGDIDSVNYDDLDHYDDDDFANDEEYRKIGSIRRLFKNNYYKPIKTDDSFSGRNNYIEEYIACISSRRDESKTWSPKEYLDMIRPYLRDLINDHKPTTELSNRASNNDSEREEWKIQLLMQNNCISTKDFEETCTIYSANKPVEIFMVSDTIDRLFGTLLQRFQQAIETWNGRGSGFTHESVVLLYYYLQKIDIRRAESFTKSHDWLANKGAIINPKNEKDNKCFQYAITSALNYEKILKINLKNCETHPERIPKIKPYISKYNWEEMEFPAG